MVGYVGRIAPEKQVERLAALRGVDGISIAIVGDGPSVPYVRRQLAGMPVSWLGKLSAPDLATAYGSFDMFVHTGTEETFGQTIQEAHATGIPVIAPRAGGPIDLVDHGSNGVLYDPGKDSQLRASVQALAADGALRSRMGEAGRRAVLPRDWESLCDELLGHYAHAIASRVAPARRSFIASRQ